MQTVGLISAADTTLDKEKFALHNAHIEEGYSFAGLVSSVTSGQFFHRRHAWRALHSLRNLLPSFALAAGRKQHVVVQSLLKPTSYMDGLRSVLSPWSHLRDVFEVSGLMERSVELLVGASSWATYGDLG